MSDQGSYRSVKGELSRRLSEPAPARVQLLTGPRQVGKTTMLLDLAREWGNSAIYIAADAPEASLPGWWEVQWQRAVDLAKRDRAVLMVDEVPYLPGWSRLVKAGIDQVYRENLPLHVVLTGSASLEVGAGARETMAGRFERLVLKQWSPRDMAEVFGMSEDEAVEFYVRFGSFPGGMRLKDDLPRWRAYIRDSIIDPAVGRDLLVLQPIRKPALLRQVFAVCVGHPAEIVSLNKITGAIADRGNLETVAHYLHTLEEAYLVGTAQKYSSKEIRRRAAPPKLIPLSNAFLAASAQGEPPTPASDPQTWGRWVENAVLAYAMACGQGVYYWREESIEVDAVTEGSWGKRAIEVKTGPYTSRDLAGLLEFCRRNPGHRPLVVTDEEHKDVATKIGIECVTWREFLWRGLS